MRPRIDVHTARAQRGITLIEVLIAMAVFATGILGISALQSRVILDQKDQRQRDIAIWQAQALIERITLNNSTAALDQYVTRINLDSVCDAAPAKICAETNDGTNEVAAATCSDVEMATYDVWAIFCDGDNGLNTKLRNFDPVAGCSLPNNCDFGDDFTLLFLWDSLIANEDPRLANETTVLLNDSNTPFTVDATQEGYRQVFQP